MQQFMAIVLRKRIFIVLLIFNGVMLYSQSDWVNYLVEKDRGLMSVHVDLGLNYLKPTYRNLLIVGSNWILIFISSLSLKEHGLMADA